jgi:dTDP-4-dehydrorhamnose reductase
MKYLITGGGGQLAHACKRVCGDVKSFPLEELDIRDSKAVGVQLLGGDCIINTAAIVRPDLAEVDPKLSMEVNGLGVYNLAVHAQKNNCTFVQMSTDYVFDGERGDYIEDDVPNPKNMYGITKHLSETITRAYVESHYIIRTSALFGPVPEGGGNFVTRLVERMKKRETVSMVADQYTVPTYSIDLANAIDMLVTKKVSYGTYHLVGEGGGVSWYDFAKEIASTLRCEEYVIPRFSRGEVAVPYRPVHSVLVNKKGKAEDISLRPWREALHEYLDSLVQ